MEEMIWYVGHDGGLAFNGGVVSIVHEVDLHWALLILGNHSRRSKPLFI